MHQHWLNTLTLRPQQLDAALESQVNAAVLMPVWYAEGQWQLLLTRRALHLRHHPGQISFPGGRIEAGETALMAAKREAFEEVGIQAELITFTSALPALSTSTGFVVKPWLAVLAQAPELKLQMSEVATAFTIPLHFALNPANRISETWQLRGQAQLLHFIPWQNQLIWGASAAILTSLSQYTSEFL